MEHEIKPLDNSQVSQDFNRLYSWLIRQRIYCERCSDLTKAVTVRNLNGRDLVLCNTHAGRLDAVRKSERKQPHGLD